MADSGAPRAADIEILLDGEVVAGVVLDAVQDQFPWYAGALIEGPAFARWREFIAEYARVDLEIDYCPHHPDEGPYEDTDLAQYVDELTGLHAARVAGSASVAADEGEDDGGPSWLARWRDADPEHLQAYIKFLDWRRWRAMTRTGERIEGIALPPALDFDTRRFMFRP